MSIGNHIAVVLAEEKEFGKRLADFSVKRSGCHLATRRVVDIGDLPVDPGWPSLRSTSSPPGSLPRMKKSTIWCLSAMVGDTRKTTRGLRWVVPRKVNRAKGDKMPALEDWMSFTFRRYRRAKRYDAAPRE
jgi:hypothetical protein